MSRNQVAILTGNTYEHRDAIRRIPGAKWDKDRKAWVVEPGTMKERGEQSSAIYALKAKGITVSYT